MPTLEERVAYLEGRLEDHAGTVGDLRNDVRDLREQMDRRFEDLDQKMDRRFEDVNRRFEDVDQKMDRRFEDVNQRFEDLDQKVGRLFLGLETKIDGVDSSLDAKVSRQFTWLVGIQVAVLVAVVGALLGR